MIVLRFVPADSATVGLTDRIFCAMGSKFMSAEKSTFMIDLHQVGIRIVPGHALLSYGNEMHLQEVWKTVHTLFCEKIRARRMDQSFSARWKTLNQSLTCWRDANAQALSNRRSGENLVNQDVARDEAKVVNIQAIIAAIEKRDVANERQ
ncbi:uncharacterized protein LOC126590365 [Malus sylvestris]|uniref:uncharacterized protein LOC126590365 n=1 Tax=Malus sylvestris TaxID=3752 RepID=UPI0021AC0920|nr:uncharacterized protein LOC126590365 [Malus sylvestris]